MDYVTFEPFHDYAVKLQQLRTDQVTSFWKHLCTMSKLSYKLLQLLAWSLVVLALVAVLRVERNFTLVNLLVVLATFFQAFLDIVLCALEMVSIRFEFGCRRQVLFLWLYTGNGHGGCLGNARFHPFGIYCQCHHSHYGNDARRSMGLLVCQRRHKRHETMLASFNKSTCPCFVSLHF